MRNITKINEIRNSVYGKFFFANDNLYSQFGAAGRIWTKDLNVTLVSSGRLVWIEINYPYKHVICNGISYEYKLSDIMKDNNLSDDSDLYDLAEACLKQATKLAIEELFGSLY